MLLDPGPCNGLVGKGAKAFAFLRALLAEWTKGSILDNVLCCHFEGKGPTIATSYALTYPCINSRSQQGVHSNFFHADQENMSGGPLSKT